MSGLGTLSGELIGQFAASITPIYFTFILGFVYCVTDVLKLDFVPAISVIIQYVSLPALLFLRIAPLRPSDLDIKLLLADALSKFIPFAALLLWWAFFSKLGKIKSLEWVITFWMLATLPNTVLIGDQILTPMFEDDVKRQIMNETTTIIFAQSLYWYNTVILLFEIREMFIEDELELNPPPPIEMVGPDPFLSGTTEDNLTEVQKQPTIPAYGEMAKTSTSWEERPASIWEPNSPNLAWQPGTPSLAWEPNRPGMTWEQRRANMEAARPSWEVGRPSWSKAPLDPEANDYLIGSLTPNGMTPRSIYTPVRIMTPSPFMTPANYRYTPSHYFDRDYAINSPNLSRSYVGGDHSVSHTAAAPATRDPRDPADAEKGVTPAFDPEKPAGPAIPMAPRLFQRIGKMMVKVVRRMLQVPLLYGSVLGFIWCLNGWRIPSFLENSAAYCAQTTVGLAMILVGMVCYKFYKGARGFVPCGYKLLLFGFFLRFLVAPLVMYICALAFNIKQYLLDYAILQVIVPQGSMTFALAQIYGCKLEVITPAIYIQMIVFVPFILAYFAFLSGV